MRTRLKTIGALYVAFGILGFIIGIFYVDALVSSGTAFKSRFPLNTSGFGAILATMFALTSVPSLIGGIALLMRQSWAKPLVLILGFVNLSIIPVGMLLGIYTIWVMMNEREALAAGAGKIAEEDISQVFPPYH